MPEYVKVDPNYEATAEYFAKAFIDHEFDRGKSLPVISFIEQIRYLTQTDLPAVERLIGRIKSRWSMGPVTVITAEGTGKAMLHEDDHLEMLHEDRNDPDFEPIIPAEWD